MEALDVVTSVEETPAGVPLLVQVMSDGRRMAPPENLQTLRDRCAAALQALPAGVKRLEDPDVYPVRFSDALERRREAAGVQPTT